MTGCAITEVKVESNPQHLPKLRKIIGCYAQSIGMSEREQHDAKLAFTEAFANAIKHGSPKGGASSILVRLYAADRTMVAEISDEGHGFDPDSLKPRKLPQAGGMGIPLMRALTDHLEFERNGRGMTVRFRKEARESK